MPTHHTFNTSLTSNVRVDRRVEQLHAPLLVLQSDAVLLVVAVGQEIHLRALPSRTTVRKDTSEAAE